jgi:four helix bundle protein
MTERGLGSLAGWQKAREFAVRVCREVLPVLPPEERWALGAQLRRSVQSAPANIAQDYGRYCFQEGVRFGYIARASLEETCTHICLARDLGYLPAPLVNQLIQGMDELRRLLSGTMAFLKRSRRGKANPGWTSQFPNLPPAIQGKPRMKETFLNRILGAQMPGSVMKKPWFLRGIRICGGWGLAPTTTYAVLFSGQGAVSSPC